MQARVLVGPIPTAAIDGSDSLFSSSSFVSGCNPRNRAQTPYSSRLSSHHRRAPVAAASSSSSSSSSSSAALEDGEQDHYSVLGISRNATSADIKKAYRLLARKHHPDVSKHSEAVELFKSIHRAYEILSNETTRAQYDQVMRFQEDAGRSSSGKDHYGPEFEDGLRIYRWYELRRKMQREKYWKHYSRSEKDSSSYDETTEGEAEDGNQHNERGPFSEVVRSAFVSLFLLQTLGARLSLTFSSLMALLDQKLDAGYKIGYLIAWMLGGRGGILLSLCLQFTSWVCGKTSSGIVVLVLVAMWFGSNLARFAPIPQGALLTLLYMSIKLQVDLN